MTPGPAASSSCGRTARSGSVPATEVCAQAERRAATLHAHGLKKGDRLAIVVPDPDEFVLSFLGAVMGGIVPVPIYPQLSFKNVETLPRDRHAHRERLGRLDAAHDGHHETLRRARPGARRGRTVEVIVTVDELGSEDHGKIDVTIDPGDLAFLQFTSGSTSRPKGVMVTHRNLAWNSESFMIHGLEKDSSFDKGVSWLPLFHDMGLIGFVIGPLFTNIPVVFLPTASFVRNPRIWLDKIHQHRGTITYAPEFRLRARHEAREGEGPRRPRSLVPPPRGLRRRADPGEDAPRVRREARGPPSSTRRAFLPSYGMAEATLAITFVPAFTGVRSDTVEQGRPRAGRRHPGVRGRGRQRRS